MDEQELVRLIENALSDAGPNGATTKQVIDTINVDDYSSSRIASLLGILEHVNRAGWINNRWVGKDYLERPLLAFQVPDEVKHSKATSPDLPNRINYRLRGNFVYTLDDVSYLEEETLLRLRNWGKVLQAKYLSWLASQGVTPPQQPSLDKLIQRAEEAAKAKKPPSNSSTHTFTVGQTGGRITVRSLTRDQDLAVVPLDPDDRILVTIEF